MLSFFTSKFSVSSLSDLSSDQFFGAITRNVENILSSEEEIVFGDKLVRLRDAGRVLMSDVRTDIVTVADILENFAEFKKLYSAKYASSYVSLSLPPLLGLLVQLDVAIQPIYLQPVRLSIDTAHSLQLLKHLFCVLLL